MAHDDKEAWTQIRSRLENTLRHMYRPKPGLDSTISMEFMMAGPSPSSLKPAVILVCCSARCQKQLKKILKTQKWIADHDYHFLVIVDPLRELSGGDGGSATESVVEAWNVTADSALGGTLARSRAGDGTIITFTLGGVVTVNRTLYALTAGHVFCQGAVDSGVGSEASEGGSSSGEDDDGSPFVVFNRGSNTSELDAAPEYRPPRPSLGHQNINSQDRPLPVDDIMSREGPVVLGMEYK
ncbi:hypothetical protein MFIFM68171_08182 [Madurella fahalii]|uniref:Uncharacterized protein n=1 Tax=Madurella fahalii TaxID=1157608 RepID=A0ABQ0GJM9_9PEZI